jgi:hypothetical protein
MVPLTDESDRIKGKQTTPLTSQKKHLKVVPRHAVSKKQKQ